jgi:hypothetical protein
MIREQGIKMKVRLRFCKVLKVMCFFKVLKVMLTLKSQRKSKKLQIRRDPFWMRTLLRDAKAICWKKTRTEPLSSSRQMLNLSMRENPFGNTSKKLIFWLQVEQLIILVKIKEILTENMKIKEQTKYIKISKSIIMWGCKSLKRMRLRTMKMEKNKRKWTLRVMIQNKRKNKLYRNKKLERPNYN